MTTTTEDLAREHGGYEMIAAEASVVFEAARNKSLSACAQSVSSS